jgi:hypothetical protein
MSSRPILLAVEWDAEVREVVVVLDLPFDEGEPAEIARLDEEEDDDEGEPRYFGTSVDGDEAEMLGRQWIRFGVQARWLNSVGINGPFSWEDEDDGGMTLCASEAAKKAAEQKAAVPPFEEAIDLCVRCSDCQTRYTFGLLVSLGPCPLDEAWRRAEDRLWTQAPDAGAYCPRCAIVHRNKRPAAH